LKFIFVSSNIHKFQEVQEILGDFNLEITFHQQELPELQSESLEEIALFSAKYIYPQLQRPLFVEDTGLFIHALNGFPGPYASYVYKTIGNSGILHLLEGKNNRTAIFKTAIALTFSETDFKTFLGETQGTIAQIEKGKQGWGYDPIFIPLEGDQRTYAEMDLHEKNQLSHRRKCLKNMAEWLQKNKPIF